MKGIIQYSHTLLKQTLNHGELAVDATCGNGHDTVVLSDLVGNKGRVLAFDIQDQAIETTKEKLSQLGKENVTLIKDSHANLNNYIEDEEEIAGAIFNLGYLPRSDKTIITKADSTITALKTILKNLKINGITVLVVYHGHEGGQEEKSQLLEYVAKLDQKYFQVLRYGYINQINNPPFVLAIKKIKENVI